MSVYRSRLTLLLIINIIVLGVNISVFIAMMALTKPWLPREKLVDTYQEPDLPFLDNEEWKSSSTPQKYRYLADTLQCDYNHNPKYRYSSSLLYREQPYYKHILALGKSIVPLLIEDLKYHKFYATYFLSDLLPDVVKKLGALYGDEHFYWESRKTSEFWLRWWNDYGSKQKWEN